MGLADETIGHDVIDVVIPMRDGARTIRAALASVAAQSLPARQIIVVDDGSSDGSGDLVDGWPGVRVIRTPPRGVSHARNTGINASDASHVVFLDCDDLWHPEKLRRQYAVFAANPQAALVTCDHVQADPDGSLIAGTLDAPRLRGHVFDGILAGGLAIRGWSSSAMVRRDALVDCGGFDESLDFGEDIDLWLRLARGSAFDYCPEVLSYVVNNPHSTTRRPSDGIRDTRIAMDYLRIIDKWIGEPQHQRSLARHARLFILSRAIQYRMSVNGLLRLRAAMRERTPALFARIASGDARFLAGLAICAGARGAGRIAEAARTGSLRGLRESLRDRRAGLVSASLPRVAQAPGVAQDA